MKTYIGTKEVIAIPAWRADGRVYLKDGWIIPRRMNREDGYKVVDEDGRESWSPKDVFERAYKPADTFLDRMKIELSDLQQRLDKMIDFVYSEEFDQLQPQKRNLIKEQYTAMKGYLFALKERIALEENTQE